MKKTLAILGLLVLLSQPALSQTLGSPDDSSSNAGMDSTPGGAGTGIDGSSGIRNPDSQGQGSGNIRQPETNLDDNTGSSTRTMRRTEDPGINQWQGSQTGRAAGMSENENNGATGDSGTIRGYW